MSTHTVKFDELEIEVETRFEKGCKGDYETQPTNDCYVMTGKFGLNGIDVSQAMETINKATKGWLFEDFNEQING